MKKLLLPVCAALSFMLHAQMQPTWTEVHPVSGELLKVCGTDEVQNEVYKQHPELRQINAMIEEQAKTHPPDPQNPPVYIIPIVFHILHDYGPENISDAQVIDEVRILNEDYRKLNADISQVAAPFQSITADCEIEFRLAQLDPNGNCTNGIDRIATPKTYKASDASKLNDWPYNKYLNVWTCHDIGSGAAGYSYYPGSAPSTAVDGVLILHSYVGSIGTSSATTSRALSHEIGHYLNLAHLWGSTNQPGVQCGDDGVSDTPVTMGHLPGNCPLNDQTCGNGAENTQNYMEYAYCQKMFTQGQRTRMRNALVSSVEQRSNLWSASNLTATGAGATPQLCTADFKTSTRVACVGANIIFTDLSWNNPPTSWQWDFNNDNVTDATTQNPTYAYSAPGVYSVKLTVSDGASTKTVTKSSYIVIMSNTASAQLPYSEGFENSNFPYNDMYLTSASTNATTWNRTTAAAYTGSASVKLDNYSPTSGDVDEFITPAIDMSSVTSPTMSFKVAYQRRSSTDTLDQLRVLTSTNCGASWVQRYSKSEAALATISATSGNSFTPGSTSQWRSENVSIANVTGQTDVRFRFEFTGHGVGNNIYIDDINISGNLGIEEEAASEFGMSVSPNPSDGTSTVSFTLGSSYNVGLNIYDLVGKEVISIPKTKMSSGIHKLPLNGGNLNSGIYFVKLSVDGYAVTKKIIVQ